jgi:hypothetical protein
MKICWVDGFSEGNSNDVWKELESLGHTVTATPNEDTEIIFNASIIKMDFAEKWAGHYRKPLVNYCWDYYKWAHDGKHTMNWSAYARFLGKSALILVPSFGQQRRLQELLGLASEVCECSINTEDREVTDGNYVLDPVRFYPEENERWVVNACEELGIPCIHSEHQYSYEEFQDLVANCTFMTCGFREASTGGLSLMEGLWNGKVSLVSDSPYMGARDYIGDLGYYFKYDDYKDLKRMLKKLWDERPTVSIEEARKYMEYYSHREFAKRLINNFNEVLKNHQS